MISGHSINDTAFKYSKMIYVKVDGESNADDNDVYGILVEPLIPSGEGKKLISLNSEKERAAKDAWRQAHPPMETGGLRDMARGALAEGMAGVAAAASVAADRLQKQGGGYKRTRKKRRTRHNRQTKKKRRGRKPRKTTRKKRR